MKKSILLALILICILSCCSPGEPIDENIDSSTKGSFNWNTSTIYFMLTDRFLNADTTNDINFERSRDADYLRKFIGGDVKGITSKVKDGYFNDLGVDAIWFTPVIEQIHGAVDEGAGVTYGFHGYWPKDWSAIDPNFGTIDDLKELVGEAHKKGIRVIMDVIINHTGPVTELDPVWPSDWVRTEPTCTYKDYETTANCTLVKNLPDILTDSNIEVEIPNNLAEKWKNEGRYEKEIKELDAFFKSTGFPRYPRHYIMKWLIDLIKDFGIDGFRVDTAKHMHEDIFTDLSDLAKEAFEKWKSENADKVIGDQEFFMLGEVYGYGISGKNYYNFGDRKVDYYTHGFNSLINFEFIHDAKKSYEFLFHKYDSLLSSPEMSNTGVLNYIASHDDGNPFDGKRTKSIESANKLLLCPGGVQIYYGDESARSLVVQNADGDATLRSYMNWELYNVDSVKQSIRHWQKLGQFRQLHSSISRGKHNMLSESPYVFSRILENDSVVIGLNLPRGEKTIPVNGVFSDGYELTDYYSNKKAIVKDGKLTIASEFETVLLQL